MSGRKISLLMGATALALVATTQVQAEDKVVTLYNWGNYFSNQALQDFTKATGIKADYQTYDSEEAADTKLMVGNSGYDLIVLTAEPFLDNEISAGVFAKLDTSKIPSFSKQDPSILKIMQVADPSNEHAAIYLWGSEGIAYNVDQVKKRAPDAPLDSYALLFDPKWAAKMADCGIALIDSPTIVLPMALQYLGIDPNKATEADYEKAADVVAKIRPYVKYINSNTLVADLANGDICLNPEWSGDSVQALNQAKENKTGANIEYFVPKEGGLIFVDGLVIPKDAPHPEAAHAFIEFMLQPKAAAQSSNELGYGNAVPASKEFLDPAIASNARIFPTDETKKRLVLVKALNPDLQRAVGRLWTKVKSGS